MAASLNGKAAWRRTFSINNSKWKCNGNDDNQRLVTRKSMIASPFFEF